MITTIITALFSFLVSTFTTPPHSVEIQNQTIVKTHVVYAEEDGATIKIFLEGNREHDFIFSNITDADKAFKKLKGVLKKA